MTKTQERKQYAREEAERLARRTGETVFIHEFEAPPLYRWFATTDPARPPGGLIVGIVKPPEGTRPAASRTPARPEPQRVHQVEREQPRRSSPPPQGPPAHRPHGERYQKAERRRQAIERPLTTAPAISASAWPRSMR